MYAQMTWQQFCLFIPSSWILSGKEACEITMHYNFNHASSGRSGASNRAAAILNRSGVLTFSYPEIPLRIVSLPLRRDYFAEYFEKWRHWIYPIGQNVWCTRRAWSKLQSTMSSTSQWPVCCESAGRPTGWLVNAGLFTAYSHELSQIVLWHYARNVIYIVVCAIINNWMANNARKLHIWYTFWNRTMKQDRT